MKDTKKTLAILQFILMSFIVFCMIAVLVDAILKNK
tara:strand:- start:77 stop:184 length:108 start_codon:yes stop_codon:yes gene_type:complete